MPLPKEREQKTRLLARLSRGSAEGVSIDTCVVEAGQPEPQRKKTLLRDLVRELWPQEDGAEGLCRTLRSLHDFANTSFLLRSVRGLLLVRTDFVRAVIEPTRVTFLGAGDHTFDRFLEEFLSECKVPPERGVDTKGSFSSWATECIVCAAVTLHSMRFQMIRPVGQNVLDNIRTDDFNSVLKLYPLKMALSTFVEQIRPLVSSLHDMLQRDDDSADYNSFTVRSVRTSAPGSDLQTSAELEEALYNWYHNAEEIMADAMEMSTKIEDSMRFTEASMSCTRNRLLKFELFTMIATVAMGMGALISGVFGMNLDNYGLDDTPGAFWSVVGVILFLMVLMICVSVRMINRSQNHYQTHAPTYGNNKFFRSIDDDEYVLGMPADDGQKLERLLEELREPALPQSPMRTSCGRRRVRTPDSSGCMDLPEVARANREHSQSDSTV